jgi:hypothetical protein
VFNLTSGKPSQEHIQRVEQALSMLLQRSSMRRYGSMASTFLQGRRSGDPRAGLTETSRAYYGETNGYFAAAGRVIPQRNRPSVTLYQQFAGVEAKAGGFMGRSV